MYRLIKDEDLDRFYTLQKGKGQPVGSSVFARRDFAWLGDAMRVAETQADSRVELELSLGGMSCIGCVWLVEALFKKESGGLECRIDYQRGLIRLVWTKGDFDLIGFARTLQSYGYDVGPAIRSDLRKTNPVIWRLGVCAAFALNSMLYTLPGYLGMESGFAFAPHFAWLSFFFATASMAVGGSYFISRAARAARNRVVHLDLPISVGLVFAYAISLYGWTVGDDSLLYFDFVSTFVFLMLVGRWAQLAAVDRNRNRLAQRAEIAPRIEVRQSDGSFVERAAETLKAGDVYRVQSGAWAPVESTLRSEQAQMGMEWINGESRPSSFICGSIVPSGARQLGTQALELEAREGWGDSLLKRLTDRKDEGSERDRLVHVWITRYLIAILVLATAGLVGWAAIGELQTGIRAFVATLVISCPCALGVALPLADELALARLRLKSVFLRSHSFWSRFSKVDAIAFDKTGTLTRLNLTLMNPEALTQLDEDAVRALSSLVEESPHPVCYTLREQLMASGKWTPEPGMETRESIGMGMSGSLGSKQWALGKASWALEREGDGRTCLALDGDPVAYFDFEDAPRNGVSDEIAFLSSLGLDLWMLSGDSKARVGKLARLLSWPRGRAIGEMTPDAKANWISSHRPDRFLVIGDGANDSLAFEAAGCCGSPAVDQSLLSSRADFYYLGDGISSARELFNVREARRSTLRALLSFAIGYNAFAAVFALMGVITPLWAAILMPSSSVVSLAIVWIGLSRSRKEPGNVREKPTEGRAESPLLRTQNEF